MTDMGTSFLPEMADYQCDCVVLDHHQIPDSFDLDQEGKVFVSCWLAGVSGAHDACASTMAFLFAMAMDESNFDLATVAVAGMMGDNQHRPSFSGYNKVIVDEAVSRGLIKTMDSIVPVGNVYESVMFTIDPYLDGITGVPDSVRDFLFGLGYNTTSSLKYGDSESAARLDEAIIGKLREKSVEEDVISRLVRKRYYLTDFECDAQLLSDTIDACGRTDAAAMAMKVIDSRDLMAGRGAYIEFRRQPLLHVQFPRIRGAGLRYPHQVLGEERYAHHSPARRRKRVRHLLPLLRGDGEEGHQHGGCHEGHRHRQLRRGRGTFQRRRRKDPEGFPRQVPQGYRLDDRDAEAVIFAPNFQLSLKFPIIEGTFLPVLFTYLLSR